MALTDTAEYWQDVKKGSDKRVFVHAQGLDCGHYHKMESDELNHIDCFACLQLIEKDETLKAELEANNGKKHQKWKDKRRKKKGFKLDTIMPFGKYKGQNKTIEWIIKNDRPYFDWVKEKLLLHPEVDEYI